MPVTANRWAHRPALDGLRCVAVLLVIGFHAQVSGLANGFVGVDVFFVLSGFLVTSVVLHAGLDDFGFAAFYGRRVRRLLPAAVAAAVATCAVALLYLPLLTRTELVSDARAALLYVANWHFIGQATDYFADDIDSSPFLHYWSLAIEEQFYLLYPLVLVGGYRLARGRMKPEAAVRTMGVVVALLAVVSLVAQVAWASTDVLRAYYGTDARLYQLLIGAATAIVLHQRRTSGRPSPIASVASPLAAGSLVAIVVIGTDVIDMSVSARGIAAAGVSLALVTALDASPAAPTTTLLSLRPLRFLGEISYMIYLVHWPVILVLREAYDLHPVVLALLATAVSTVVAAVSFRLLEQPIRRAPSLARLPRASVAAGLSLSLVAAVIVVPPILQADVRPPVRETSAFQFEPPADPTPAAVAEHDVPTPTAAPDAPDETIETESPTPTAEPTVDPAIAEVRELLAEPVPDDLDYELAVTSQPGYSCTADDGTGCVRTVGDAGHVHLIGDSNASMFRPMFVALADDHDLTFSESTYQGCPWQRFLSTDRTDDQCVGLRDSWYERLDGGEIDADLIVAVNLGYGFAPAPNLAYYTPVGEGPGADLDDPEAMVAMVSARTEASLDALDGSGAVIVLVEPLRYEITLDPATCLSGAATVGECAFEAPEPNAVIEVYRRLAAERPNVVSLDLHRFACPNDPVCLPLVDGHIVYKDPTHLSIDHTVAARAQFWDALTAAGITFG